MHFQRRLREREVSHERLADGGPHDIEVANVLPASQELRDERVSHGGVSEREALHVANRRQEALERIGGLLRQVQRQPFGMLREPCFTSDLRTDQSQVTE